MRTITLSTIALLAAAGCVYDNNCPDRGKVGKGELTDTGQEEEIASPEYFLTPDVAVAGETVILSLQSDEAVNFDTIEDILFLDGDISVCTMSARDDELLVTVAVSIDNTPGAVDLLIDFEDGSHLFLEAGFTVLDPNADEYPEQDDGRSEEGESDDSTNDDGASDEDLGDEDDGDPDPSETDSGDGEGSQDRPSNGGC